MSSKQLDLGLTPYQFFIMACALYLTQEAINSPLFMAEGQQWLPDEGLKMLQLLESPLASSEIDSILNLIDQSVDTSDLERLKNTFDKTFVS